MVTFLVIAIIMFGTPLFVYLFCTTFVAPIVAGFCYLRGDHEQAAEIWEEVKHPWR